MKHKMRLKTRDWEIQTFYFIEKGIQKIQLKIQRIGWDKKEVIERDRLHI